MKNKTFLPDPRPANVSLSPAADYDVMGAAALSRGLRRGNKELLSAADVLEMII
ncbi:hypothetical protein PTR36_12035 [Serratia bockelmannii]|uniref:hypothetical protein n=1 Tax=Serratia bockelmannii TaxID=2703793 RepID=UPI00313E2A01